MWRYASLIDNLTGEVLSYDYSGNTPDDDIDFPQYPPVEYLALPRDRFEALVRQSDENRDRANYNGQLWLDTRRDLASLKARAAKAEEALRRARQRLGFAAADFAQIVALAEKMQPGNVSHVRSSVAYIARFHREKIDALLAADRDALAGGDVK